VRLPGDGLRPEGLEDGFRVVARERDEARVWCRDHRQKRPERLDRYRNDLAEQLRPLGFSQHPRLANGNLRPQDNDLAGGGERIVDLKMKFSAGASARRSSRQTVRSAALNAFSKAIAASRSAWA
jgi:hypothetical protein